MKSLQDIAEKIANLLDCRSGGSCGVFARWVTKIAVANGITNFTIVFGYVKMKSDGNWKDEHIWIESKGQKIDPTVAQFYPAFQGYSPGKRRKFTPKQFLEKKSFCLKNMRYDGINAVKFHLKNKTRLSSFQP